MEYKIKKLSEKMHNITEEESDIIKRSIPFYKNVLDRFEKQIADIKEKRDKDNKPKSLDDINPFSLKSSSQKENIPSFDEVRTFVYSAWAKTVADIQTPYGSDGKKKKGIMKHTFRQVEKGYFINRNVKEIMNNFLVKISLILEVKKENEIK